MNTLGLRFGGGFQILMNSPVCTCTYIVITRNRTLVCTYHLVFLNFWKIISSQPTHHKIQIRHRIKRVFIYSFQGILLNTLYRKIACVTFFQLLRFTWKFCSFFFCLTKIMKNNTQCAQFYYSNVFLIFSVVTSNKNLGQSPSIISFL